MLFSMFVYNQLDFIYLFIYCTLIFIEILQFLEYQVIFFCEFWVFQNFLPLFIKNCSLVGNLPFYRIWNQLIFAVPFNQQYEPLIPLKLRNFFNIIELDSMSKLFDDSIEILLNSRFHINLFHLLILIPNHYFNSLQIRSLIGDFKTIYFGFF